MEGIEITKTSSLNKEDELNSLRLKEVHRNKIGNIAREIEAILIREDMTWGEWGEVIDLLNARTHSVVSSLKLKKIQDDYDNRN
jgi:hypothetical protein